MNKDIYKLDMHCNSFCRPNISKQKMNKRTECNPMFVRQLFKQLNIHGNGHLLEK